MVELVLKFWTNKLVLKANLMKVRTTWTGGTHNRTEDGMYVLYLDYDRLFIDEIERELQRLHDMFDIGTCLLFNSSDTGVHVVSLCKFSAKEYLRIVNHSSCDVAFKNVPVFSTRPVWVLRFEGKGKTPRPKYLNTLEFESDKECSLAHYKFFSTLYPEAKIKKPTNSDKHTIIGVVEYATAKHC